MIKLRLMSKAHYVRNAILVGINIRIKIMRKNFAIFVERQIRDP